MIAIIDYDAGNIRSVEKAFLALGAEVILTRDREILLRAEKVVLPGVGAFEKAMQKIRAYGLEEVILEIVRKGTPFLGICLGLQLLFESSEEGEGIKGLGLLKGQILKIPDNRGLKVPHIGWNSLEFPKSSKLFRGIEKGSYVYFVHSYYLEAADKEVVAATTEYAAHIHAAVEYQNIFGCQFHPEKSSNIGLSILKNFIALNRGEA